MLQSVYADMAVSSAKFILKYYQDDTTNTAVLIKNMDMQESLTISDAADPQIIQIEANCVWKQKKVEIVIRSVDNKGQFSKVHAKSTVAFADRQQEQLALRRDMGATVSQIESLKSDSASGLTERFTCSMAYRMVASLAHYDTSHKGVKEVYLNSTSLEAAALIFSPPQDRLPGDFALHPCVFDSILQLATFVLNANENSRFDQEVFVVRGWDSAFIDEILTPDHKYETFVKMTARDKDVSVGDIAILDDNRLIGCIKGARVQRVPRRLMDVMFRSKTEMATTQAPPTNTVTVKNEVKEVHLQTESKGAVNSSRLAKALSIIAEESGIGLHEMKNEDLLSSLGIDSLLILVIASRFREELQLDLQATFFAEVDSIGAIKAYFNGQDASLSLDSESETRTTSGSASPKSGEQSSRASSVSDETEITQRKEKIPVSTSVVLQGTLRPGNKTIFLFPDGSGSATSYMNLPRVHENVAVIAMNCPYMTTPTEMQGSFEDIARILLTEVRRRQPKGPYYLGGWSAGGAFAYCATQMLQEAGEEVKSLLLIDAPCPIGLGKLPQAFFDFWRKIHMPGEMMGDRPLPSWLMDHFKAVNENLRGYNARPLPRDKIPKTYLAWAAQGTDNLKGFTGRHLLTDEENADLGFLMDDKTDFGTRGWEKLLGDGIVIDRAMSSNHFTIVRGDGAKLLSSLIKRACLTLD